MNLFLENLDEIPFGLASNDEANHLYGCLCQFHQLGEVPFPTNEEIAKTFFEDSANENKYKSLWIENFGRASWYVWKDKLNKEALKDILEFRGALDEGWI